MPQYRDCVFLSINVCSNNGITSDSIVLCNRWNIMMFIKRSMKSLWQTWFVYSNCIGYHVLWSETGLTDWNHASFPFLFESYSPVSYTLSEGVTRWRPMELRSQKTEEELFFKSKVRCLFPNIYWYDINFLLGLMK